MQQANPFLLQDEQVTCVPALGVTRTLLGYDDRLMMVSVSFEKDADGGGVHSHEHTQSSYILSGVFDVTVGDETKRLKGGDAFYVAPDVRHGVVCIQEGSIIDAFSPCRQEFVKK